MAWSTHEWIIRERNGYVGSRARKQQTNLVLIELIIAYNSQGMGEQDFEVIPTPE